MKICLILTLIILVLLLAPIKINFFYDDKLNLKYKIVFRFLFFKFQSNSNLFNIKEKNNSSQNSKINIKNKKTDSSRKSKNKKNFKDSIKERLSNKSLFEKISFVKKIYELLGDILKKVLKTIKIDNIELVYVVSGEDAADIGIKYGRANILVYNFYNLLRKIFNVKNSKIYLYPDFVNYKEQKKFNIEISFNIMNILIIFVGLLFKFGKLYFNINSLE